MVLEPLTARNTNTITTADRHHRPRRRPVGSTTRGMPVEPATPANEDAPGAASLLSRPRERFEGHLGPAFRLPAVTVHELEGCGYPARG